MKAQIQRNIKSGNQYNKYFGAPLKTDPYMGRGTVYDTLEKMERIVLTTLDHTKAISKVLQGPNLMSTASNIWHFLYEHVQYKEDKKGTEQLRSPNRTWYDRKSGVDCDCYSIFISSVLNNLKVAHKLRITEYDHKGHYQHVYVIIDRPNSKPIIIDPVVESFNYEKPYTTKHDKNMIQHQYLNGIDSVPTSSFGNEFNLSGLGNVATNNLYAVVAEGAKQNLKNTFNLLATSPEQYEDTFDVEALKEQIAYVVENWHDETARNAALEEMAEMEESGELSPVVEDGMEGIDGLGFWGRSNSFRKRSVAAQKIRVLRKRRKLQPRVVPATKMKRSIPRSIAPLQRSIDSRVKNIMRATRQRRSVAPCSHSAVLKQMHGLSGLGRRKKGGFWSKVKGGLNKAKTAVKTAVSKGKDAVKKVAAKAKEIGKKIIEKNPVSFAIRKGLILAFEKNLLKMSSRLAPGLLSESQARAQGYDVVQHRTLKKTLEKVQGIFTKIGGATPDLHRAIYAGKSRFDSKNGGPAVVKQNGGPVKRAITAPKRPGFSPVRSFVRGMDGLGLAVASSAVAAAGPAAGVIAKITGFLKKVDFKKLFSRVKNIAPFIKERIARKDAEEAVEEQEIKTAAVTKAPPTNPYGRGTSSGDFISADIPGSGSSADTFAEPPVEESVEPTAPPADGLIPDPDDSKEGSNKGLLIAGGVGVLAVGALLLSKRSKKSLAGLNGVDL